MINSYTLCFVCEEGVFHSRIDKVRVRPVCGNEFTVKTKYAVCSECGTEVQTAIDTASNVRNMEKLSDRVNALGRKYANV